MKRLLAMGSIKNGVRSMLIVRHNNDGRAHTTFRVDKLAASPLGVLPSIFAERGVTQR